MIDRNPVNDRQPEPGPSSPTDSRTDATPASSSAGIPVPPSAAEYHDIAAVGKRGDPDPSRCRSMTNSVVDGIGQRQHHGGAVGSNRREIGTELDVGQKVLAIGDMQALECVLDGSSTCSRWNEYTSVVGDMT